MTNRSILDKLADVNTRFKVLSFFLLFAVLPAGGFLVLLSLFRSDQLLVFAGLYLAVLIIICVPVSGLFSYLLVLRNLSRINDYCQLVRQGVYRIDHSLPPEKGNEHDFLRAKRNLYWMGQFIATREEKLFATLNALRTAQASIMDSISYASRIQRALLPPAGVMSAVFADHFIWWDPRDVVGGDIYWVAAGKNGWLVAAIDCTGHGVPGALMTMIAHSLFERCVQTDFGDDPARILAHMDARLKATLHRGEKTDYVQDGFDAALCHIDVDHGRLCFAGAGLPLYYATDGGIVEIGGDRFGVGDHRRPADASFTNHDVDPALASYFYLATDGLVDQIGGRRRLPYGKTRFKAILNQVCGRTLDQQRRALVEDWRAWGGDEERRDDLTVIGFSLPQSKETKCRSIT
jgi:serine phosphatase RsbU (regulator of sigma subunit)